MKSVKATREGLVGHKTAAGLQIAPYMGSLHLDNFFVALPCKSALRRFVRVRNPLNNNELLVPVMDVGPWNTDDAQYVYGEARPKAESGESVSGKGTNGAGIDLSDGVWTLLGMKDNGTVEWEFV